MMNLSLFILISLLSAAAFADTTMICRMGDIADMDIRVESLEGRNERLTVTVYSMDGESKTSYTNSSFDNSSLSQSLAAGHLDALVSVSDLQDTFGGAYLEAGRLVMKHNKSEDRYDVQFAAKDVIFTASCR
ncbi:hypothetical protein [Bdellovibrio bacteriovorus]|uniref:hypothetical protein n=1 Tax=Bdellovibrio bacteriovorus TaxID=959 RepID=UPI00045C16E3|nr:hypothetical protein [Bdellovibrio bacteriovorus]AHZ84560.1 hypothetical protein EP01_06370 [Bdellovibrio bacteriovorus]BEV68449.1 hypothetical protein Bb109J_c1869 [Bdellovibrio bacteriovorus]